MPGNIKFKFSPKIYEQDKMYGVTTIGARGQLVIPAQARKDLKLQPGDQLVVMGKFGKVLGLVKAEQLAEIINMLMEHIGSKGIKAQIQKHLAKVFKGLPLKNAKK